MAATAVAANAYRSVSTCAAAPSRLRLRRPVAPGAPGTPGAPVAPMALCVPGARSVLFARAISHVAARLTQTPASATPSMTGPVTAAGVMSLRTAQ